MKRYYTLYVRTETIDEYEVQADTLDEALRKHADGASTLQREHVESIAEPHLAEWADWQVGAMGGMSHGKDDPEGTVDAEQLIRALARLAEEEKSDESTQS